MVYSLLNFIQMDNTCYLLQCPLDLIIYLFDFIDTCTLLTQVKLLCKKFHDILWSEKMIEFLVKRCEGIDKKLIKERGIAHNYILHYTSFFNINYEPFLSGRKLISDNYAAMKIRADDEYDDIIHKILVKIINGTGHALIIHMKKKRGKTMILLLLQIIFCFKKKGAILCSISNLEAMAHKTSFMKITKMLDINHLVEGYHYERNYVAFNNGSIVYFHSIGEIQRTEFKFEKFDKVFIDEMPRMLNNNYDLKKFVNLSSKLIWIATFFKNNEHWYYEHIGTEHFKWRYDLPRKYFLSQ